VELEQSDQLDPAEVCPGPPEAVFWPPEQLHRWTPVSITGVAGDRVDRPPENAQGQARVTEVCLPCRQWRVIQYTRVDVSPQPHG
jgi:hypothetical protein